jgi:hypothetical protein
MIDHGLAVDGPRLMLDARLEATVRQEASKAMREIARILLLSDAPIWLFTSVSEGVVKREYIPTEHLRAMQWLGADVDQVILDAHAELHEEFDSAFRKRIGDAAEVFVLAGLQHAGLEAIHVAQIDDRFGYDIEVVGTPTDRIEVKAASARTRGTFHLTRNEFDKSRAHGAEWRLIQVVFLGAAFVSDRLDATHVEGVYELVGAALAEIVPDDTPAFKWTGSAVLSPPEGAWHDAKIRLDPSYSIPGFGMIADGGAYERRSSPSR